MSTESASRSGASILPDTICSIFLIRVRINPVSS
jgi:hypothetical protein